MNCLDCNSLIVILERVTLMDWQFIFGMTSSSVIGPVRLITDKTMRDYLVHFMSTSRVTWSKHLFKLILAVRSSQ